MTLTLAVTRSHDEQYSSLIECDFMTFKPEEIGGLCGTRIVNKTIVTFQHSQR